MNKSDVPQENSGDIAGLDFVGSHKFDERQYVCQVCETQRATLLVQTEGPIAYVCNNCRPIQVLWGYLVFSIDPIN